MIAAKSQEKDDKIPKSGLLIKHVVNFEHQNNNLS